MNTYKLKAKMQSEYKWVSFPEPNSPWDSLHVLVIKNLNFGD